MAHRSHFAVLGGPVMIPLALLLTSCKAVLMKTPAAIAEGVADRARGERERRVPGGRRAQQPYSEPHERHTVERGRQRFFDEQVRTRPG